MLEDWEKFTLSIQMMKNTEKLSRTRGENWKYLWLQPCRAKDQEGDCGAGNCIREEFQHSLWLYSGTSWIHKAKSGIFSAQKIKKTTLHAKDLLRCRITTWYSSSSWCQSDENSGCQSRSGQGMEKARDDPSMEFGESQEQKRRSFWKQELGMSICSSKTRIILFGKRGWHQNCWREADYGSHVENNEKCGYWRTHIISWPWKLGMYSAWNADQMKQLSNNIRRCLNHVFQLEQQKNYRDGKHFTCKLYLGPTTWRGMLQNALSDTVTWQTRKWSNFTQSFKSLPGWSSIQAGRNRISWRIARSLLRNCLEMLVPGTNWMTWLFMVGQQACKISPKMDSCMWETIGKIDFVHSSHKRIPTILSCGNTAQHCRLGLFQDSDFAGDLRRCLVYFWK